ncbi:hypothetical protein [Synoicihabitans lomoniglobus]|uniref:Lipoprotein n=1 Tax=Synoicihabitans lomoniglobus TaxID=2909285 RepID=A0AAE9ZW89_9BACT|nr:hypothetical protein [Opitutaceae bacterium LMO-M01]WED65260.1 hypothetical protein PXH66_00130 [Opitutaceae bacterium LMO-M01]WED65292.1 hypothetical protein PXH66_00320 [Opitutaceae bacterium LMO-M01]
MKTPYLRLFTTVVFSILLSSVASAKSTEMPRLQVTVETPTVFDIMNESDIADALVAQLQESFRRGGFEGRITHVDRLDKVSDRIPLLTVRLSDWERRRSGFVECRFTAKVTTVDGQSINLGSFNGHATTWNRSDRFTLSQAFEDAAADAMRELYRDYRKLDTATADTNAK